MKPGGIAPAPRTTGEQFLRGVMLDVAGERTSPADGTESLIAASG